MNVNESPSESSDDSLVDVTCQAMLLIWGKLPNAFQKKVIPYILSIHHYQHDAQSIFLVQGAGGGKSLVYQCTSMILTGVILVIKNTLSLSADQCLKISNTSSL